VWLVQELQCLTDTVAAFSKVRIDWSIPNRPIQTNELEHAIQHGYLIDTRVVTINDRD